MALSRLGIVFWTKCRKCSERLHFFVVKIYGNTSSFDSLTSFSKSYRITMREACEGKEEKNGDDTGHADSLANRWSMV